MKPAILAIALLLTGCMNPPGVREITAIPKPDIPCPGDTVTLNGHTYPNETLHILMGADMDSNDLVEIGTATSDSNGAWNFVFQLKPDMGLTPAGKSLTIQSGGSVQLRVQIDRRGYMARSLSISCDTIR